MTSFYLFRLNYSIYITAYVELPLFFLPGWFLRSQLVEPMMLGSKGSVDAAFLALQLGWAINLSGGFHHASRSEGGGFCIFPDITFIVHYLKKYSSIQKICIIDLDAHQGNGHEIDHINDPSVFIVDAYNHNIYPGDEDAKPAIAYDINLSRNHSDDQFI